jgi:formiminotetrahydrofolate cyclodeaminase
MSGVPATSITADSIEQFLERLASQAPTPGGGSVAAIMGAMGAGLVSMVCNVSLGKKGLESIEAEMLAVRGEAEAVRAHLTTLVTDDVAAFDALMAAYKLPKNTDDEKQQRAAAIQGSLIRATLVPLACARACAQVIALARRAGAVGYKGVVSDAGVGVLAAYAALRSAALNVFINAPALKDQTAAAAYLAEINALVASASVQSEAVYSLVRERL